MAVCCFTFTSSSSSCSLTLSVIRRRKKMMKMVVMFDVNDERSKERIIRCVAKCSGITTISMEANDGKLTVIGDFDVVKVLAKLTRIWNAKLATYGSYDPKKEAEAEAAAKKKKEEAEAAAKKKKEETEKLEAMHVLNPLHNVHPCLYPPVHHHTTVYDHDHGCVIL